MEYKTKLRKDTDAKGQRKDMHPMKVNRKQQDDVIHRKKEVRETADDIADEFPNFNGLNSEEKLAFFEALSAARQSVEMRGHPIRERFGTIHDEYLKYFEENQNEKKKTQSVYSARGLINHKIFERPNSIQSGVSGRPTTQGRNAKKFMALSLPQKFAKLPSKNIPQEPETIETCESFIQKDTEKIIDMYLKKKDRIEEKWKKSSPEGMLSAKTRRSPQRGSVIRPANTKTTETPPRWNFRFEGLSPCEKREFFRVMQEAQKNVLAQNPDDRESIPSVDEVLSPYKAKAMVAAACTTEEAPTGVIEKSINVKVVLTSGDNKRLCKPKSETETDVEKASECGRSKSVETMQSSEVPPTRECQSSVLKKAMKQCYCGSSKTSVKKKASVTIKEPEVENECEELKEEKKCEKPKEEKKCEKPKEEKKCEKPKEEKKCEKPKEEKKCEKPKEETKCEKPKEEKKCEKPKEEKKCEKPKEEKKCEKPKEEKKCDKPKEEKKCEKPKEEKKCEKPKEEKKCEKPKEEQKCEKPKEEKKCEKPKEEPKEERKEGKKKCKKPKEEIKCTMEELQSMEKFKRRPIMVEVPEPEPAPEPEPQPPPPPPPPPPAQPEPQPEPKQHDNASCECLHEEEKTEPSISINSECPSSEATTVSNECSSGGTITPKESCSKTNKRKPGKLIPDKYCEEKKDSGSNDGGSGKDEADDCDGDDDDDDPVINAICPKDLKERDLDKITDLDCSTDEDEDDSNNGENAKENSECEPKEPEPEEKPKPKIIKLGPSKGKESLFCKHIVSGKEQRREKMLKLKELNLAKRSVHMGMSAKEMERMCAKRLKRMEKARIKQEKLRRRLEKKEEKIEGKHEREGDCKCQDSIIEMVTIKEKKGRKLWGKVGKEVQKIKERRKSGSSESEDEEEWEEEEEEEEEGSEEEISDEKEDGSEDEICRKGKKEEVDVQSVNISVKSLKSLLEENSALSLRKKSSGGSRCSKQVSMETQQSSERSSDESESSRSESSSRSLVEEISVQSVREKVRRFPSDGGSDRFVLTVSQSKKSNVSFVEERPKNIEEIENYEKAKTSTKKVVLVDDSVIGRIRKLIGYLENKVNSKNNMEKEYVDLVLSYMEYLTKVAEGFIQRNEKQNERFLFPEGLPPKVQETYNAETLSYTIRKDGPDTPQEESKATPARSISQQEFKTFSGPSFIDDKPQETISMAFVTLSDSEHSLKCEDDTTSFKKVPGTRIRLLQDLLSGRAEFEEGSIDDFKIVHRSQPEFVPQRMLEKVQEFDENDEEEEEPTFRKKFVKKLAKLCKCGRKQAEEEAILENLKGEAVRVVTINEKKNPTLVTLNESTMEVLRASERKKIIERYFKNDY